ncbi:Protein of unknown function DUF106-transmembrane [Striga hermonthica]|uniref:ER membrane protein complex subunit 3 n=1 Tax=Striga hermonthica TaxID=68872 RepID=A0A9N7RCY9_STRHE|nr:Protein of unknown function DUF106-transmembrane [Striga hermonthica]
MAEDLVLDTAIRDWVLIPLSVVMVLIGILRYFVSKLMRSDQTPDLKIVKEGQLIIRARNLRAAANFIPARSFRARKHYYSNEEDGLLHVPKGQGQNPQAQMFSDPNMAMDMMKKNLSMIIPQTLTFAWVNFFFSGFVAAKIPFPLTQRFRGMLQNGIDLSTVDVSYVSSRSWYFLNLFGLRGLFSLILGEDNATDDTQRMMQMSGFGFDPTRSLGAEKDNLDIVQHEWALPKFEQRAEAVLKKLHGQMRQPPNRPSASVTGPAAGGKPAGGLQCFSCGKLGHRLTTYPQPNGFRTLLANDSGCQEYARSSLFN